MCVWAMCFLPLLAVFTADQNFLWSKGLLLWATIVAIGGLAVVGLVALLCRNVGKLEGASRGFLCGLAPSAAILAWVIVTQPGLAGVGPLAFAFLYAIPGGVGGTLAGIICSGQNRTPA